MKKLLFLLLLLVATAFAILDPSGKVSICHVPPGNPDNVHLISVAQAAVPAHVAHGDFRPDKEGQCIQRN
jgi:hypothetical protein